MKEVLKEELERLLKNAKIFTGKQPIGKRKSSLSRFIKTKEQADRLMKQLKELSEENK